MFKKTQPDAEIVERYITQFPHCESRILHAPGECQDCDEHPLWQALRMAWGICFTGYEPEAKELPDPATAARGLDNLNAWVGNVPNP